MAQKIFGDVKAFFEEWGPEIREIFASTFQLVFEIVQKVFDGLKEFWDRWGPTITEFFNLFLNNLKAAFELGLEEILSAEGGDRKEAIFRTAAMIGGVVLARAVKDPRLSDEILKSVRQKLD